MDYRLHSLFQPLQINGTTPGSRYVECLPSAAVLPYVACYWESGTEEWTIDGLAELNELDVMEDVSVTARVLPDGCSDILITNDLMQGELDMSYCGNYTQPFAFYKEPSKAAATNGTGTGYTFGVRFFPGGARVFHGMALDEFTDRRIPLEQCWPGTVGELQELRERMQQTTSFRERVRLIDAYLNRWLNDALLYRRMPGSDLLKNVLHRIFTSRGQSSIKELATLETVSERQLHRSFKPWIGISPKRFSEVVRSHQVLACIQRGNVHDWPEIALAYGYFDQAHLIRHFRAWYGATPGVAAQEHQQKLSVMYNTSRISSGRLRS
ncbi:helix-turn-helix domain-containing protein [Paenibacillus medicaginis]|uniref:Helix-turn-helix domain-containing protein n=1 Tax=Paenibacillus medicaginis TaxID=1470560 RepID=A0ABV5BYA3_9BACL